MSILYLCGDWFQHTAARRRLGFLCPPMWYQSGFNTQPPEGGWHRPPSPLSLIGCFNTQPPEGGWPVFPVTARPRTLFQHTAARRRLAVTAATVQVLGLFQHTAARRRLVVERSQPGHVVCSFNTQPPEGGWIKGSFGCRGIIGFQHTAARRRLGGFTGGTVSI